MLSINILAIIVRAPVPLCALVHVVQVHRSLPKIIVWPPNHAAAARAAILWPVRGIMHQLSVRFGQSDISWNAEADVGIDNSSLAAIGENA